MKPDPTHNRPTVTTTSSAAAVTAPLPTKCSTPGCKFPVVAVSAHDGKPVCRHCQEVIG